MDSRMRPLAFLAVVSLLAASLLAPSSGAINCAGTSVGRTPLDDLGQGTYQGFEGGLYPDGANERPATHTALGLALGRLAVPRNADGVPDPVTGKLVFLSIGMSNTRNEFTQFVPASAADPLKHPRVQAVNGAIGGQTASAIRNPNAPYWGQVDALLAQAGATPEQVQAVWLKEANAGPSQGFPAEAQRLQGDLQAITHVLKDRFPNLWLVYLSSRIYAGYATTALNPEGYAHESGFSVKWVVEDQLGDPATLLSDDLRLMPWVSWGPYLWADGLVARSDGLTWLCSDFANDGTHPNTQGSRKVADLLLDFVHTDPTARAWYVHGGMGPPEA